MEKDLRVRTPKEGEPSASYSLVERPGGVRREGKEGEAGKQGEGGLGREKKTYNLQLIKGS
jgi:hypothetical protein